MKRFLVLITFFVFICATNASAFSYATYSLTLLESMTVTDMDPVESVVFSAISVQDGVADITLIFNPALLPASATFTASSDANFLSGYDGIALTFSNSTTRDLGFSLLTDFDESEMLTLGKNETDTLKWLVTGEPMIVGFKVSATAQSANATVAPVPEPGTLLLLGSGLIGLVYLKRRKT